jgi:hypothetical protein
MARFESKQISPGVYPATAMGWRKHWKRRPVFVPYNTGVSNIHVDQMGFQ